MQRDTTPGTTLLDRSGQLRAAPLNANAKRSDPWEHMIYTITSHIVMDRNAIHCRTHSNFDIFQEKYGVGFYSRQNIGGASIGAATSSQCANPDPTKSSAYLLYIIVYNLLFNPLRKFPGPTLWAISSIPYVRMCISGQSHRTILQLHQKYGPIVRIGPNDLSMNHPDAMKDLRGHRKTGTGENSKDPILGQFNADNIIGADRLNHQRFRRALARGFSNQAMLDQEPIITAYVDTFVQRLHQECEGGAKSLDMAQWFNFTTFDIIGDLAFGESFGCLDNRKYHPWVQLIFQGVKEIAFLSALARLPWLSKLLASIVPKSSSNKWSEHRDMSRDKVRRRLALEKDRPDFVDAMIKRTQTTGINISFEELASNANILILAGSETTATLLSAALYYLTTHAETLAKLKHEVRSTFAAEREIDMASVQQLSYMLAVLDESLRLFPPVAHGTPRLIREGGDTIIGQYIPGGATVDIWHWAVYHNPEHFAQPDDFVPERWLNDPRFENDAKRAMQAFSMGPRECIGKNLAYAEMRLILARLIWNFDIRLAADSLGWEDKSESYLLWQKGPVNVFLTPRAVKEI
ncbi:hypothetical protein FDECE_5844 [Fusarium decemcellulare]|nr:hypothetical protein FDECE_5844 [Fusarium decemcellulare]